MKRPYLIIAALLYLGFSNESAAHTPKEGDIRATAGPYFYRTRSSQTDLVKNSPYLGAGLVAEGDVDYNGGVEIAILTQDKLYIAHEGDDTLAERITRLHITTGYRHWVTSFLSLGLAFYSSYSMGDAKVILDDRPSGQGLETSAREITEYGLDLSAQWEVITIHDVAIVVDGRYSLSVTRKIHENADLYGFLIGLKYLLPKQPG